MEIMPKVVDHDEQRRRIADAAIRAIGDAGLDRVRLVDVAREARATTGTLTHYFDGKDALLCAALERVAERLLEGVGRLEGAGDLRAKVALALPLDARSRDDWAVWLAFWGRAISNPELAAIHNRYYTRLRALLVAAIERGRASGELSDRIPAGDAADAVITAVDGLGLRASLDPAGWPPARQRKLLDKILVPLLAPEPPASDTPGRTKR